jgi:hypothetical protein
MFPQLNFGIAAARHQEFVDRSARRGRGAARSRRFRAASSPIFWEGLTLRLATSADRPALAHLAELEQASRPPEPVLLGVVMQRPIAALSLSDGSVLADPFAPTAELVELLRLRARQLSAHR